MPKADLRIRTAFEGSYVIGSLVMLHSVVRQMGDVSRVTAEVAINSSDFVNVEFFHDVTSHLKLPFKTIEFNSQTERRVRYNSPIALSKMYFLEQDKDEFLWLDSDLVAVGNPTKGLSNISCDAQFWVVPRSNDVNNFNSGVFFSSGQNIDSTWRQIQDSDFYTDQHILQKVFEGRSAALSITMNQLSLWGGPPSRVDSPLIRHYVGEIKPWHISNVGRKRCIQCNCEYAAWYLAEQKLRDSISESKDLSDRYLKLSLEAAHHPFRVISTLTKFLMWLQSLNNEFVIRLVALPIQVFGKIGPKPFRERVRGIHPFH